MIDNTHVGSTRLSFGTKFAFGSGAMAEAIYMGLFNTFITIFYNQVIGLSNTLIGIAVMLALVGDALTDPVVGIISDRWRGKYGRRHPFMFVAPVPLALTVYCIFNPPQGFVEGGHQLGLFIWLALTTILSRAFLTLYQCPAPCARWRVIQGPVSTITTVQCQHNHWCGVRRTGGDFHLGLFLCRRASTRNRWATGTRATRPSRLWTHGHMRLRGDRHRRLGVCATDTQACRAVDRGTGTHRAIYRHHAL